jgi:hypothetical protein
LLDVLSDLTPRQFVLSLAGADFLSGHRDSLFWLSEKVQWLRQIGVRVHVAAIGFDQASNSDFQTER